MAKKQKPNLATHKLALSKRYRDDVTGRFVTKKYAKKNRKTTTRETVTLR